MNNDWLQQLLPGDEVVVQYWDFAEVQRVERITPTQIIVADNGKFRRCDGHRPGWPQSDTRLMPATEEAKATIRDTEERDRLIGRLTQRGLWHTLTLPQLREINARLTCMEAGDGKEQT